MNSSIKGLNGPSAISIAPAAARSSSRMALPMSAISRRRTGRASSTSAIRQSRASLPKSTSRKAPCRTRCGSKTASCSSTARSFRSAGQDPDFPRRAGSLRCEQPGAAAAYRELAVRAACTASRSMAATSTARPRSTAISAISWASSISGSRPARRGRALVDAGTMDRRRRDADLEGHRPSLPPPDARRQPALRQLLARRLRHPRHRGHVEAEFVSGLDWRPPFPWPTHTALPVPFPLRGRRVMLVADEDVVRPGRLAGLPLAGRHHRRDAPDSVRELPGRGGGRHAKPDYTGLHQLCEEIRSTEIPIAWFAHGLRIVDIAEPARAARGRLFMPPVPEGARARAEQ